MAATPTWIPFCDSRSATSISLSRCLSTGRTFSSIAGLRSAVNTLSKRLYQGTTTNQYLVLQPVTEDDLAEIEEKRHTIGRGLRFTYCTDIDTLIIKVPTPEHEAVTRTFTYDFMHRIEHMGLTELDDLKDMGSTAYRGTSTRKEPDSCWRPLAVRPNRLDWPTLVFRSACQKHCASLEWMRNGGWPIPRAA
jgi:hypothetical protein